MMRVSDIPLYHWRLKNKYPDTIENHGNYRLKVNVWGAISYKGASEFVVS